MPSSANCYSEGASSLFYTNKIEKIFHAAFTGIHFPFGDSLHKAYVGTHFLGLWAVSELKFTHMWGDFRIPFGYRIPKEGFINGYTYLLKKVFNGAPSENISEGAPLSGILIVSTPVSN